MNPFDKALEDTSPIDSALSGISPPPEIQMALDNFQRRMSDPDALPEWVVILQRQGPQGVIDYINEGTKLTEAWHGRSGRL